MRQVPKKLKELWIKLVHENDSPNQIAAGFAIGFFATFFPIPVLDTAAAFVIAWMLGVNKSSCLIGNNFVLLIYPVIPLLVGIEFCVGKWMLHESIAFHVPKQWNISYLLHESWPNVRAFLLGGMLLGTPSAIASFFGIRSAVGRWQKSHSQKKDGPPLKVL